MVFEEEPAAESVDSLKRAEILNDLPGCRLIALGGFVQREEVINVKLRDDSEVMSCSTPDGLHEGLRVPLTEFNLNHDVKPPHEFAVGEVPSSSHPQ